GLPPDAPWNGRWISPSPPASSCRSSSIPSRPSSSAIAPPTPPCLPRSSACWPPPGARMAPPGGPEGPRGFGGKGFPSRAGGPGGYGGAGSPPMSGGAGGGGGAAPPPDERGGLGGSPPRLTEPLTDSEARILRYLPTHLTAQEIARELSLSVHTVTTHMRHLYAKLGVHRRRQAVEHARALDLLAPAPWGSSGTQAGRESQELCDARPKVWHQAGDCIPARRSGALPGPRPRAAERDDSGRVSGFARSDAGTRDRARGGATGSGRAVRCAVPYRRARPRASGGPPHGPS